MIEGLTVRKIGLEVFQGFSGINEHEIAWEVLLREMAG